uniref:Uncharacterized protein n=1 Tax=Ciona savignyi TaxID=51511 RepID=H2Z5C5_CIOSA
METIPEIKKVVREIPTGFYIRQRYVLAFLGFMGHILISSIRNCVNVTIISMTQAKEINQSAALFNESTAVNDTFFCMEWRTGRFISWVIFLRLYLH